MSDIPDAHFGTVGGPRPDWRDVPETDFDPDDEEIETPPDVLMMLGFDPKEFAEGDGSAA